jgi:DNA-binding NtrC family response regulator
MNAVESEGYRQHDVPSEIIQKWQKTVDLMAEICEVPAGLIMRVLPTQIEVLLASHSEKNPYEVGEKAELNTGLYCETVMAERKPLIVPNALEDPDWKDNPDVALNMISYMGVPLVCPDGSVFGTICVLDDHTRDFVEMYRDMLSEFRSIIEQDLRMLDQEQQLRFSNLRLSHELAVARELSDAADRKHRLWLQGESIAVRALRESIELLADSDDAVLMTGPIGAGQEAVARAIHRSSPRATRPFIYVACPHVTVDDTVFGLSEESSPQTNPAKMALADGGTFYLEGIEALSRSAQKTLLEWLQDASRSRAAGQRPAPDVRVIAHASINISDAVGRREFNDELARLLGVKKLRVPSLVERRDDVITLANTIVADRARSLGKALDGLSSKSKEMLLRYSWPGNLRELQSVIERAVVLPTGTKVDIPPELLREGRHIGGYTLGRQLGSGAMGEVWLAQHALLARPSAVKLIREDALRGDASAREMLEARFQREARATAQLRSPHTVELYDFGVTDEGGFYYVMEYLNGIDLDSLVKQFGPISPARAIHLLSGACMSLDEAHTAGLVHRDIKPANLITCQLGPHYDFLKLLDFGIVRATGKGDLDESSQGQIRGTPTSLSPEVIDGQQATFASDIYGLGCVAYWLLAAQHVFDAPGVMALLMKHLTEPPKPIAELRSDLPAELGELVMQCLEKKPQDRPESAAELGRRLESISLSEPWDNGLAKAWWLENMSTIGENQSEDLLSDTLAMTISKTD